jgi:hypothetical protein
LQRRHIEVGRSALSVMVNTAADPADAIIEAGQCPLPASVKRATSVRCPGASFTVRDPIRKSDLAGQDSGGCKIALIPADGPLPTQYHPRVRVACSDAVV